MAIEFACPSCGGTLQVGDESAGRVIRCGACMTALRVPAADAAAPDPYEVERPAPLPPPPARPEPSADAPIEPRRRRDPDDPYDARPRRRRPPPPPPAGYGVFFWLVVIGAVMLLGVVGCCGALFVALPGAKWQKHESDQGGFRVDMPAPAQPNAAESAGIQLDQGRRAEGTVLLKRPEQFFVFYRDVPGTKERAAKVPAETDEQLIDKEIQWLLNAMQCQNQPRGNPITVGGFDGRELDFWGESGWYTARVIVADTRVYVVVAGGGMAKPGDESARRFLKSFEITNPKLVAEGKRRAEQAKRAADDAKEAKARVDRGKAAADAADIRDAAEGVADAALRTASREARAAREAARREAEALHDAAEAVAGAALAVGLREARPAPRLPPAPPPRRVDD